MANCSFMANERIQRVNMFTFTTIDTMHCLFLGVLRHHCCLIWGMDLNFDDRDGAEINVSVEPAQGVSEAELLSVQHILCNGSNVAVRKLR